MLAGYTNWARGWLGLKSLDLAANEQGVNVLLAAVEKSYAIDQKKVVVTGFSMGGRGTWDWADKYPDRFSAAIPISGTPAASGAWRWS